MGINDLARATALASVGLAPSTGAAAGAARAPGAAGRPWTSLLGAAWASGAAPRRWTMAGAASCPWTPAVRTSRTSPVTGEDGGRIAGGGLWRGGGGGSCRGDSIATERSQRRPSPRWAGRIRLLGVGPPPRPTSTTRLLGERAGGDATSVSSEKGKAVLDRLRPRQAEGLRVSV
jgi:hypothetical protein